MTQPDDPACTGCDAPICCRVCGVHHVVRTMVEWCRERQKAGKGDA